MVTYGTNSESLTIYLPKRFNIPKPAPSSDASGDVNNVFGVYF